MNWYRFKKKFNLDEITLILCSFIAILILLMIAKDYISSLIFNSSFYISESLLFKVTIALLFVPTLLYNFQPQIKTINHINVSKIVSYLIPICVAHILVSSLLIAFISEITLDFPFSFGFLVKNKFINDFIFIMAVYSLMFLIVKYYSLLLQKSQPDQTTSLLIKTGTKTEIIELENIDWIAAETPYVAIWVGQKKYLYHSTLTGILQELDNNDFVRIHRSTIVNITKITSLQSRANGDYDILLHSNATLRLSRNYRKNIKNSQLKL